MGRALVSIGIILVTIGALFVLAGLFWPYLGNLGLGRLPGDIVVKREHLRLYFPIASSLLVSLVLSVVILLLFWLLRR